MRSAYTILFLLVFLKPDYALAQDSHGCLTRAAALIDRSLFSEAIEIYTEAMEKDNDYRLFTGRGDAFLMAGMTDEAARDYAMANQLRPGSGYLGLARAYALSNQTEDAISNLKYHLQSAFKLARKDILLDPYFTYMEDSPAWKQLWKDRWYSQLEDAEAETEYYVRTGKIERAREVLSEVEHIYSEQTPILYLKGLIESAVNNSSGALKYLGAAVDRDDSTYDAWRLYIEQLGNKGDYLSAANACDRALSYFPGQTGLILEKAENLRLANDRGRALLTAESYLSLYPDDELANRQVGIIAGETGDNGKALRHFSKNIDNYPGVARSYTDRAGIYLKIRSWDAAVYDYSMALDLWPRDGEAYYNKGLALLKMGKTDEACHDFRMALRYGNRRASGMLSKHCIR